MQFDAFWQTYTYEATNTIEIPYFAVGISHMSTPLAILPTTTFLTRFIQLYWGIIDKLHLKIFKVCNMTIWYHPTYLHFFNFFFVSGHVGCFHTLAIVNSVAWM